MIKEGVHGFCMALADSVPGVSGGTIAFIMGFYDQFIGSINNLVFGKMRQKKQAFRYLFKLGIGWLIGMGMAVLALSSLFESHIYMISSLFIGFIAGSLPVVVHEEYQSFRKVMKGFFFLCLGIFTVVIITWLNGRIGAGTADMASMSPLLGIKLFFIGMIAISAMFLPGDFRFHTASDLWNVYPGDQCGKRTDVYEFCLLPGTDDLWTWCTDQEQ